jgi:single-strand DNA-binding protein
MHIFVSHKKNNMEGFNEVILMGTVVTDPLINQVGEKGTTVATFRLVTNKSRKNQSGERETTPQFHTIKAWGKLADTIKTYVKKSQNVHVVGELQHRTYKAKDGTDRNISEVVIDEMVFVNTPALSKSKETVNDTQEAQEAQEAVNAFVASESPKATASSTATATAKDFASASEEDDDLPF